jgi:tetratricopeptide (TPR) repeat protein
MSAMLEVIELERDTDELPLSGTTVSAAYKSLLGSQGAGVAAILSYAGRFEDLGMEESALEAYGEALRRDSLCGEAYRRRGELRLQLGIKYGDDLEKNDFAGQAAQDFEKALFLNGSNHVATFKAWAMALLVAGQSIRCREAVEARLAGLGVEDLVARSDLLYVLGFARLFSGLEDEALVAFGEMERLGRYVEDSVFGQAVVDFSAGRDGSGSGIEVRLGEKLSAVYCLLKECGCRSFLDVARALVAA